MEGSNSNPFSFAQNQALNGDLVDDASPISIKMLEDLGEHVITRRAKISVDMDTVAFFTPTVDFFDEFFAEIVWNEFQRLFVHGAFEFAFRPKKMRRNV